MAQARADAPEPMLELGGGVSSGLAMACATRIPGMFTAHERRFGCSCPPGSASSGTSRPARTRSESRPRYR